MVYKQQINFVRHVKVGMLFVITFLTSAISSVTQRRINDLIWDFVLKVSETTLLQFGIKGI